ncbi:MAG: cadherin-like beta sandwich domain-containing protein [Clostridia bacterium]|nr:cadherin-like beta sandwich domain-containing protein [Clostridia bacterium]
MKKHLGIIILIFILSFTLVGAMFSFAQETPRYEITDQSVEAGSSFSVIVSLKDNPGIISLKFKVSYDEKALRLDSVEDLGLLEGFTNPSPDISSPYTLRWSNSLWSDHLSPGSTAEGELVKLNFTAISSSETTTKIKISHEESYNYNGGSSISFADSEANITIKKKYSVTFYDEDGTTVISSTKYFTGDTVICPEDPKKPNDETYKYTFTGWTPEVAEKVENFDLVYTATYKSEVLSTDSSLSSLSITGGQLDQEFSPERLEYSATLDFSVSVLEIICTTTNKFATYSVVGTELSVGENIVTMTVTAENGDSRTITFKITRKQDPNYVADKDATLRTLIPSTGVLSPTFLSTQKTYILYIENSVTSVSFEASAKSDKALGISGLSEQEIKGDVCEIKITCTAENGDTATYVISVVRLPEYNGKIPEFSFKGDEPVNPPDDPTPPEDPNGSGDEDPSGDPNTGTTQKPKKPSKAVVVIIIAASVCAVISLAGVIILVVMSRKNKAN